MAPIDGRMLDIFRVVAETGSATRAADHLNTSQPNVTRIIGSLERACGFPLFERGRFGMALTRQGEVLLRVVDRNFAGMRLVQRTIGELRGGLHGSLWSIAIPVVAEGVLGALIGRFSQANPQISVNLRAGPTEAAFNAILSGEVDFGAIIGLPPRGLDLEVVTLGHRELMVAVAPGHRLANRERVHITDLDGEAFVLTERPHNIRLEIERMIVEYGVRPSMMHEASPQRAVAEVVRNSNAIGFIEQEIIDSKPSGSLVGLAFAPEVRWSINLIYRRDRDRSVVFDAFLGWLTTQEELQ